METSCKNGPSQTSYGNLTARETVHSREISYTNPFSRSMERRNSFLRMDQERSTFPLARGPPSEKESYWLASIWT